MPIVLTAGLALAAAGCLRKAASALPKLKVDPARVAVAGLSSGAYMATQIAYGLARKYSGAALVSGGPYGCAAGDLRRR